MRRVLVGALAVALSWVPFATPAQAGTGTGTGTVTGINGVLYDDCVRHSFRYSVSAPPDAGYRDLQVRLVEPDGRPSQTVTVYPDTNDATGVASFIQGLCPPGDLYGTYTIRATLRWGADPQTVDQHVDLADTHFSMRKPSTRTSLSVSTRRPAHGQRVVCRIRVFDERPTGYLPTWFTWVHLEKRRDGRWVRVKGSRALTHEDGRIKVRVRYLRRHHQPLRIRAVTEPAPKLKRSVSPVVRLW
jgi:hypothetical protein